VIVCDILYIDPPYNERQYAPNYHLYETFIRNDNPTIHGKTGLRDYNNIKSTFCTKRSIKQSIVDTIIKTNASLILYSYSTDGILSEQEFIDTIETTLPKAKLTILKTPQKRYKADNKRKNNTSQLFELLFVISK
jgi:adenine-specific DNA-methyltransferase